MTLLDARGVEIGVGDTVIYGFGVGRSVAMAEGIVLGERHVYRDTSMPEIPQCTCGATWPCLLPPTLALTPQGRVWVKVVRRSYGGGEKPKVHIAPDRLVVLKQNPLTPYPSVTLPPSPLPTQDEEARKKIQTSIGYMVGCLADPEGSISGMWVDQYGSEEAALVAYVTHYEKELRRKRKQLKELDEV